MTGAFIRIQRDGRWLNLEPESLTDAELDEWAAKGVANDPTGGWRWAVFFASYLRDQCVSIPDPDAEDGETEA